MLNCHPHTCPDLKGFAQSPSPVSVPAHISDCQSHRSISASNHPIIRSSDHPIMYPINRSKNPSIQSSTHQSIRRSIHASSIKRAASSSTQCKTCEAKRHSSIHRSINSAIRPPIDRAVQIVDTSNIHPFVCSSIDRLSRPSC